MFQHASLRRRLRRAGIVTLGVVGYLAVVAGPAVGHVDLESSSPADGTVVTEVPALIELRFTAEAVPVGRILLMVIALTAILVGLAS